MASNGKSGKMGLRGWHGWVSILLAVPIALVSLTAVLIAHDKALGLKQITLPLDWLPGYAVEGRMVSPDPRALLITADGTEWIGTNRGLFIHHQGQFTAVEALGGIDVRAMMLGDDGRMLLASKTGLWLQQAGGGWQQAYAGESWGLSRRASGEWLLSTKDGGILQSADGGKSWQQEPGLQSALAGFAAVAPEQQRTLHNLVMDLHTGKAILGKSAEWLWIDLIGGTMLFLTVSGVFVWWRSQRQKRRLAERNAESTLLPPQGAPVA